MPLHSTLKLEVLFADAHTIYLNAYAVFDNSLLDIKIFSFTNEPPCHLQKQNQLNFEPLDVSIPVSIVF